MKATTKQIISRMSAKERMSQEAALRQQGYTFSTDEEFGTAYEAEYTGFNGFILLVRIGLFIGSMYLLYSIWC